MRPTNQAGPRLLGGVVPEIPPLSLDAVDGALIRGALIVDARDPDAHAQGHIAGSLSIPAGASFGTWLGWVVEADRPVVLLVEDRGDLDGLARQALRIGFETMVGHVAGGFEAWRAAGRPVEVGERLGLDTLASQLSAGGPEAPLVIDVRQPSEYGAGHVPGSRHIGAGDLPEMLDRLPRDRPIAMICASGYRSSVAFSLLQSAGFTQVTAVDGGVPDWAAHGYPLEYGGTTDDPAAPAATVEGHAH
jgi:hydroxyacylglutathione hydrolase